MSSAPLRIGKVRLRSHHPTVIVPVTDRTPLRALTAARAQGVDLAEARVNLFRSRDAGDVKRAVAALRKVMPVLVTLRSSAEGGGWHDDEPARLALYRALLPVADAVDIELAAAIRPAVVAAAQAARKPVVLSHHDFRGTPTDAELERLVERGFRAGAGIVKLATHVRDDRDVTRLAALLTRHPERPLVVIGMGEHGKKTRVLFPAFGSRFTFAALGRGTAPGQLGVAATRRELALFFPEFAARLARPPSHRR